MNTSHLGSHLVFWGVAAACAVSTAGCSGRSPYWNEPVDATATPYALTRGVVVVDDAAHRAAVLTAAADLGLSRQVLTIGHHFANAATSPDGSTLFVLSSGDWPRQSESDELPSLTVIAVDAAFHAMESRYTMSEPLGNLAIDPQGKYVVAYQGSRVTGSFAQNPNEIVIFDLTRPFSPSSGSPSTIPNPVARDIRSFGGSPQRLTFSPTLNLPANAAAAGVTATPRRLLVVETQLDVTLLDLDHAFDVPTPRPEITVRLTSGANAKSLSPAGLVIDANPDDGRIALRTQNDSNVYTLQLLPSAAGSPNDFNPTINLTDVGGVPSDIAFVRTDQGLRVAALVPTASAAVLVEPDTSATTNVALPAGYSNLSLVTNVVAGASSATDVALLWSAGSGMASGVALWALGVTVGQPYRSIEVLQIDDPISNVSNVPSPNDRLKILQTMSGGDFFVLDLVQRTAAPLHTTTAANLSVAPDGHRVWAFAVNGTDLAAIDLATLNPVPLTTSLAISSAFDVARPGGRALVALHSQGALGATVFDALAPDTATSRWIPALLLEGP
jgi:hypothetical protein